MTEMRVLRTVGTWIVFVRGEGGDWVNLKLHNTDGRGGRKVKRNYYLGWSRRELRFSRSHDYAQLVEKDELLARTVEQICRDDL